MKNISINSRILLTLSAILLGSPLWAVGTEAPDKKWYMGDGTFWILMAVIVILFYVIYALAEILIWGGKKKLDEHKGNTTKILALLITAGLLVVTGTVNAQDATAATVTTTGTGNSIWKSPYLPLYILIVIEIVVITYLTLVLAQLTRKEKLYAEGKYQSRISKVWEKWNYKVPIEREEEILIEDHDYDGIHELDNSMPPWLQYIFYFTIIFAIVYLWYYNLGGGPTQIDEYNASMEKAKIEQAAYLLKAAANYDENSVVLSSDPTVISAGKNTFTQYCATCHGDAAEGKVGPNLTDDYWIHGGKINDLFTTVKYGVQGKAMASWKDILTPKQIFEVTNYIKSLHGTNPPGAKPAEGNLYVEGAATDSTAAAVDSLNADTLQMKVQ